MTTEFKVGDKVRIIATERQLKDFSCNPHMKPGGVHEIGKVYSPGVYLLKGFNTQKSVRAEFIEKVKLHPHHDIIIAWLEGKEVEYRHNDRDKWSGIYASGVKGFVNRNGCLPSFYPKYQYRIKSETTPAEIELKELQSQINKLTEQAEKLAKTIKEEQK